MGDNKKINIENYDMNEGKHNSWFQRTELPLPLLSLPILLTL